MTPWGAGLRWSEVERAWLGLFATLPGGRVILRHELTWWRISPEDAAADLLAFLAAKQITLSTPIYANHELFPGRDDEPGETISQTFGRAGVRLTPGSRDRLNGWSRLRSWLRVRTWPDGGTGPALVIHPDCLRFLKTLPTLVQDKGNPEDFEDTPAAYPAHAARYFVMGRVSPWLPPPPPVPGPGTWGYELRHVQRGSKTRPRVGADCLRPR